MGVAAKFQQIFYPLKSPVSNPGQTPDAISYSAAAVSLELDTKLVSKIMFTCPADPIVAIAMAENDTSISMRWVTPASATQQGVAFFLVNVTSECFTDEQKGQPQSFNVSSDENVQQVTAGHLGKLRVVYYARNQQKPDREAYVLLSLVGPTRNDVKYA